MILCISLDSVVNYQFSSLILYWIFFLFLLISLTKGLLILFISSKNQLSVLLSLCNIFKIDLYPDFYHFFLSTDLGFDFFLVF